jgi:hypothetical protein
MPPSPSRRLLRRWSERHADTDAIRTARNKSSWCWPAVHPRVMVSTWPVINFRQHPFRLAGQETHDGDIWSPSWSCGLNASRLLCVVGSWSCYLSVRAKQSTKGTTAQRPSAAHMWCGSVFSRRMGLRAELASLHFACRKAVVRLEVGHPSGTG